MMKSRALKSEDEQSRHAARTASAGRGRASRETTQATPAGNAAEIFGALVREVANNTRTIAELVREVRCLRQERQPAASAILEELCCAIYGAYGRQPFTAAEILDVAIGDVDDNTERLSEAIIRATGTDPNPNTAEEPFCFG